MDAIENDVNRCGSAEGMAPARREGREGLLDWASMGRLVRQRTLEAVSMHFAEMSEVDADAALAMRDSATPDGVSYSVAWDMGPDGELEHQNISARGIER
jgi:hypothetical protein